MTGEDGDRELVICDGRTAIVPFAELLIPSWLLAAYDLAVTGAAGHLGRAAYVVRATRRGGRPRTGWPDDRVTALVDAELGILLRYEESGRTGRARVIEFTSSPPGRPIRCCSPSRQAATRARTTPGPARMTPSRHLSPRRWPRNWPTSR